MSTQSSKPKRKLRIVSKRKETSEKTMINPSSITESQHESRTLKKMLEETNTPLDTITPIDASNHDEIKRSLNIFGVAIISNMLTQTETAKAIALMKEFQQNIPNHDRFHNVMNPHGIYKYHRAGHSKMAWYIRTRPAIINLFAMLWNVSASDLHVSYDGSCYIPKNCRKKDKIWTHSDQAPNAHGFQCYQGLVALTSNEQRTLVVYPGSHKVHQEYFESKGCGKSGRAWQRVDPLDLADLQEGSRQALSIPAGALVIWDSRVFHQNQYGKSESEERRVQYVCYMPKHSKKNTQSQQKKRIKYFIERRTTSHWPDALKVNSLQANIRGNDTYKIDYDALPIEDLSEYMSDIKKLVYK